MNLIIIVHVNNRSRFLFSVICFLVVIKLFDRFLFTFCYRFCTVNITVGVCTKCLFKTIYYTCLDMLLLIFCKDSFYFTSLFIYFSIRVPSFLIYKNFTVKRNFTGYINNVRVSFKVTYSKVTCHDKIVFCFIHYKR